MPPIDRRPLRLKAPPGMAEEPDLRVDPARTILEVVLTPEEMREIQRLAYYQQVDPSVLATEWVRRELRFLMSIRRDRPPGTPGSGGPPDPAGPSDPAGDRDAVSPTA